MVLHSESNEIDKKITIGRRSIFYTMVTVSTNISTYILCQPISSGDSNNLKN